MVSGKGPPGQTGVLIERFMQAYLGRESSNESFDVHKEWSVTVSLVDFGSVISCNEGTNGA